jgi:hypothetical protein
MPRGPKGERRPDDVISNAVHIMRIATDQMAAGARLTLLSRLEKQPIVDAARWTRDELYEDDR